jgi:hypothetical protein
MARAKPSWSYKAGEKGRNRVRVYQTLQGMSSSRSSTSG